MTDNPPAHIIALAAAYTAWGEAVDESRRREEALMSALAAEAAAEEQLDAATVAALRATLDGLSDARREQEQPRDDKMMRTLTADERKLVAEGNPWAALLADILALPQDAEDAAPDAEEEQAHG